MTHEKAVWAPAIPRKGVWQVDRTEGPCRVRARLEYVTSDFFYIVPKRNDPVKEATSAEIEIENREKVKLFFFFKKKE